jgi:integrase
MPKLKNVPPKLCRIKATNTAVVSINGRRIVLGPYGSEKSLQEYARFLAEWTNADVKEKVRAEKKSPTVAKLVAEYLKWAEKNIAPPHFVHSKTAASFLVSLHRQTPVENFGPIALTAVQQKMAESGRFSRNYVNDLISRARTMFNWGVANELVPESVAAALKYVQPLREGRTTAPESAPREDVPDEVVDRTLSYLFTTVAAMVQVQRLAAMRPSEVCRMMVGDIDQTGEIWIYRPGKHKGSWRGHHRAVALGTPEQELIGPRLAGKSPESAVFSPIDAMAEKKERDAARRKTKVQPSQVKRAKDRARNLKSRVREFYDSNSYRQSIEYAIKTANKTLPPDQQIPHWTPYQLRHAAVTELTLENDGNLDIARAVAGQKSISVTQVYNHADLKIAIEQAKKRSKKAEK